jgi:hypothetical protein
VGAGALGGVYAAEPFTHAMVDAVLSVDVWKTTADSATALMVRVTTVPVPLRHRHALSACRAASRVR